MCICMWMSEKAYLKVSTLETLYIYVIVSTYSIKIVLLGFFFEKV